MEGVNILMQNVKLTPKQESFVKLANKEGFTTEITRKDIISLQSKHGITKPAWLMKNTAYRVNRASYTLPTLGQVGELAKAPEGADSDSE
jgi:hypothetical protein